MTVRNHSPQVNVRILTDFNQTIPNAFVEQRAQPRPVLLWSLLFLPPNLPPQPRPRVQNSGSACKMPLLCSAYTTDGSIVETRTPKQTSISTVSFLRLETLLEIRPILYVVHALHRKRALSMTLDIGLHCRWWCELGRRRDRRV